MTGADTLLRRIAARQPIDEPVALVVAHPDDETIGAGAVLPLFRRLVLVHVTDGAPRNLADASSHGFADAASYAFTRRAELQRALAVAGVAPDCAELSAADQGASELMVPLTLALRDILTRFEVTAVLSHPYEGGHPDHDATAFIAAHAGLPVVEFASYHANPDGGMEVGEFLTPQKPSPAGRGLSEGASSSDQQIGATTLPHPGPLPEGEGEETAEAIRLALTQAEQRRKRAMLDCFATQAATLAPFGTGHEIFRPAPPYDFSHPPHPGTLHYERYDWGITGARWRQLAIAAHHALC